MTGPEFANSHGNDSSTWTATDFDVEQNLAEIDALPAPVTQLPQPTPTTGQQAAA